LFSLRLEFPSDWAKFKAIRIDNSSPFAPLTIIVRAEHYPFWSQGRDDHGAIRLGSLLGFSLYAVSSKDLQVSDKGDGTGNVDTLTEDDSLGGL
jgi:hypothetical protein